MIKNIEGLLDKVKTLICEQTDIAVVGLSGGADSTLVATLCTLALGKENVYGLNMPYSETDKQTFNTKSWNLVERLGINGEDILIRDAVDKLSLQFDNLSQLNQGNMRSRMRMVSLYTKACEIAEVNPGKRVRVVGTGNLSEDYIGYDTKGGDALADFFPIGSLLKSEVYQLHDYFIGNGVLTEELVDRVPSAGLWDGQTDEDELGMSYDAMQDSVLRGFAGNLDMNNPIDKFVYDRHVKNKHKHEAPLAFNLREFC